MTKTRKMPLRDARGRFVKASSPAPFLAPVAALHPVVEREGQAELDAWIAASRLRDARRNQLWTAVSCAIGFGPLAALAAWVVL